MVSKLEMDRLDSCSISCRRSCCMKMCIRDRYGVSVVLGLVETAAVWAVGLAGTEGAMMLLIINVRCV